MLGENIKTVANPLIWNLTTIFVIINGCERSVFNFTQKNFSK